MSWLPGRRKSIQSLYYTYTIPRYEGACKYFATFIVKAEENRVRWHRVVSTLLIFFLFRISLLHINIIIIITIFWYRMSWFFVKDIFEHCPGETWLKKKNSNSLMHDIILLLLLYHHRYPSIDQVPENLSSCRIWIW